MPALGGVAVLGGICCGGCQLPGGGLVRRGWSGGAWSRGGLVRGGAWSGGCLVETPHPTATAAGGTHPTGMHSCYRTNIILCKKLQYKLQ